MKLENIRFNFSFASEEGKRDFFWKYVDKRLKDFESKELTTVKVKTRASKANGVKKSTAKLTLSPAQLAILKALNLV